MSTVLYPALWPLCGAFALCRLRRVLGTFAYPHEWMRTADRALTVVLGPISLLVTLSPISRR